MKKLHSMGMGAVVVTAAFSLFTLSANAQQPPAAAPAAPGVVAPVKPAAPPAAAKAPVTAPAATTPAVAAKKPAKVASPCQGLDETACKANPVCGFVTPTKADAKTGKVDKAYCRKVAGVALKPKPAAAAAPAATPAAAAKPAATPAPAAAAAAKPTVPGPATKQ